MSVRSKQHSVLLFCAATVPAILVLPKAGWLWAGVTTAIVSILLYTAQKRERNTNPIPLAALLGWNLLALGAASDLLCSAFEQGNELIGLLLLLLAAYAASKGECTVLRVSAVIAFALTILYGTLLGFSLPEIQKSNLKPEQMPQWTVLAAALVPMLGLYSEEKVSGAWQAVAIVFAILAAVVSAGSRDFYTAMKSVSILGAMERLEPIVSVAVTLGGFCLLGMICSVNETIVQKIYPKAKVFTMPINFLLGGASIWISRLCGGAFLAIGTAIFWGLLPFLPQSLEKEKKFEKNQKNA
ncbi:MAG: hypothetical protein E7434_02745 [Ruminococcaceae bacterium]|nr:hypothetical protein [Oscillospiraceae bacterium]